MDDEPYEWIYMDYSGCRAYELDEREIRWLESEPRPEEFWRQRAPLIGKFGGYVRRIELAEGFEILPPKTYHYDRSHPD